jgi:penicillin-binding protein 1A
VALAPPSYRAVPGRTLNFSAMKQALARVAKLPAAFLGWLWTGLWRHALWLAAAFAAVLSALAALYVMGQIPLTPTIGDIQKAKSEQPTTVLSADGKELAVFKRANRQWVKLADISTNVLAALIATEDHRFFEHRGLDLRRTLSAALHSLRGDLQGGSTLTQQLARNLYPDQIGRAPTIDRKIKEAITALKIEAAYDKNAILETYLNTVPFLYNAYGIEMAARTYFGKTAGQLDVLESATLIGMLKGTSYYNPVQNPERAVQRRNTVLAQMVLHGKLEQSQFDSLKDQPLRLDFEQQTEDLGPAPHLTQQLRRWLIAWADRKGYNIFADGLVVRTTIDSRLQALATEALVRQADKLQQSADKAWGKRAGANKDMVRTFVRETAEYRKARDSGLSDELALKKVQSDSDFMQALWRGKTTLQAAFLALDPTDGHVKAWVGSRDFEQDQFDHVQQARRQPGSTFKPFVYGAAFEQGISPWETFIDQAVEFRIDDRTVWKPADVHSASGMPTTLRDGLVYSKNTITAQLMQRVGPARVAQVAQAMGVRQSKLDQVPSLALGTSPVTLKEMVSAYGTIANSGSYVEPMLITAVENRKGAILEQFQAKAPEQGLATPAAQTLLDVMRGVVDRGTGAAIRSRFGLKGDLAGKTGTTQDNTDGWFILMHPNLVSGAWVGFNDNRITMGDSWGQGARNALNIVGDFFQQSTRTKLVDAKARFTAPRDQGQLDPLLGRTTDLLGGVYQSPTPELQDPQRAIVIEPSRMRPPIVISEPGVVTIVPSPNPDPYPLPQVQRGPDDSLPWYPERQRRAETTRSPDYPFGPGFSPAPQRPPQIVIRPHLPAPEERHGTAELGAGPAPPPPEPRVDPPSDGGFRILREVRP